MKTGSDWYKRYPVRYLGGVQGFSAKEHAVYSVILELIYQHGGSVNNDPAWIAGWISDMGSASVRKIISSLCKRGKLDIEGDQITEKRAKTQAKTKENVSEAARNNGRKGGKKSAEMRAAMRKNNSLGQADASSENRTEKTREEENIEEESKASSSSARGAPKAEDLYLEYVDAHPRHIESPDAERLFSELIDAGEDPKTIIAAARAYAETVKGWSAEAKVQGSDNFLHPQWGKWRGFIPQPKAPPPSQADRLQASANMIRTGKRFLCQQITATTGRQAVEAGLVTEEECRAVGVL